MSDPFAKLAYQDNPASVQTNLQQIKQRWDQLMSHLGKNVASSKVVASNTSGIAGLAAEIATIQAEINALEAASVQRTFAFFAA